MHKKQGKVYLIGAGPGDEGLLTVKASKILAKAEVVVYDRLVSEAILAGVPEGAEKINVGKNAGNHPVPQEQINQILLEKALEGKLVVRLKGGDSFLFGRGGEELELLSEQGIPFEVVPGITSAIAAAAYAGIPVTHRDFCSSLHIITGHAKADGKLNIDYASLVKLDGTLVFMMSVSTMDEIAKGLISAGMTPEMPVAVIENGTRYNQRKFVSTLSQIAETLIVNQVKSPAAIVVGKVCTLSDKFDWFTNQPLKGVSVLVTRPKKTAGKLSALLTELGANAIEYPCIKTEALTFSLDLEQGNWLLFTSAVGVNSFFAALYTMGKDSRALAGKSIAAVGTETAAELLQYGIKADFIPSVFDGVHLAKELLASGKLHQTDRAILYRAKIGTEELVEILQDAGVQVTDVPVYDTLYVPHEGENQPRFDYAAFTSASTVEGFAKSFGKADYSHITAICIGEQTAKAAKAYGMQVLVSKEATIASMAEKIQEVQHGK